MQVKTWSSISHNRDPPIPPWSSRTQINWGSLVLASWTLTLSWQTCCVADVSSFHRSPPYLSMQRRTVCFRSLALFNTELKGNVSVSGGFRTRRLGVSSGRIWQGRGTLQHECAFPREQLRECKELEGGSFAARSFNGHVWVSVLGISQVSFFLWEVERFALRVSRVLETVSAAALVFR